MGVGGPPGASCFSLISSEATTRASGGFGYTLVGGARFLSTLLMIDLKRQEVQLTQQDERTTIKEAAGEPGFSQASTSLLLNYRHTFALPGMKFCGAKLTPA